MNALINPVSPREDIELKLVYNKVTEPPDKHKKIKCGIGMSAQWDPAEAGREAMKKAMSQLDYEKPNAVFVFATIHYEKKKSGLKKLLGACWELLSDGTPLIGGTITGFICPEGFAVRGVVIVAIKGNLDCTSEFFDNVRSNPIKAGKTVSKKIKKDLSRSEKPNRIIFNYISGPKESYIWTTDYVKKIICKVPQGLFLGLRDVLCSISAKHLQEGVGFEDIILESMETELKDYYMFGSGTFDDLKARRNYLFHGNNVFSSALVSLGISTDQEVVRKRYFPLIHSGKKFKIKRGWKNYWIDEINGKPAITEYTESLGYPKYFMEEHTERFMHTLFQLPLGFEHNNYEYAFPTGFFMGKSILTNLQIKADTVELLYTSNALFIKSIEEYFDGLDAKKRYFTLSMAISTLIGNFGSKISIIKDILDKKSKGEPYLLLFDSGDFFKVPGSPVVFSDYSLSFLSIES